MSSKLEILTTDVVFENWLKHIHKKVEDKKRNNITGEYGLLVNMISSSLEEFDAELETESAEWSVPRIKLIFHSPRQYTRFLLMYC